MKKIIALFLLVLSISLLSACGDKTEPTDTKPVESNPTTAPTDTPTEEDTRYSVTVLYPDGTPVTSNCKAQWCNVTCSMPRGVDENGVIYAFLEDADYHVHLTEIPAGYTYNPNIYATNANNKHITINLSVLNIPASGDGSANNPYVVSTGYYNASLASKFEFGNDETVIYYSFTPTEDGNYTIESQTVDQLATNEIDPIFANLTVKTDFSDYADNTSGSDNFKYALNDAKAGTTYTFIIAVNEAQSYPASFDFLISKNA